MGSSGSTLDANQQTTVLGFLETSACGRSGSSVSAVMNGGSPMSSKKPVFDRILIVAVLSLTCTNAAVAQLEEIIVTAEKRSKSVQNVAIAINAFSEESLKNFGFTEPRDLMYQTPGLIVSYAVGNNLPNFALRAVGLNEYAANNSSPVAIHLDEVYLSSAAMLNFGLFDFERVEVLKGRRGPSSVATPRVVRSTFIATGRPASSKRA